MTTNESLASRISAATPSLELREAAVVALAVSGEDFHTGRTYSKDAAFGQQTRVMNANEGVSAYVVYRHAGGTTIYLSKSTILHTATLISA